jgi:hypothetical protein
MIILKLIGIGILSWLAVIGLWALSAYWHNKVSTRDDEEADDP